MLQVGQALHLLCVRLYKGATVVVVLPFALHVFDWQKLQLRARMLEGGVKYTGEKRSSDCRVFLFFSAYRYFFLFFASFYVAFFAALFAASFVAFFAALLPSGTF